MLDKIQENWLKCIDYATNTTDEIFIGDYFELSDQAPEEVKKAYNDYNEMVRHLEQKKKW